VWSRSSRGPSCRAAGSDQRRSKSSREWRCPVANRVLPRRPATAARRPGSPDCFAHRERLRTAWRTVGAHSSGTRRPSIGPEAAPCRRAVTRSHPVARGAASLHSRARCNRSRCHHPWPGQRCRRRALLRPALLLPAPLPGSRYRDSTGPARRRRPRYNIRPGTSRRSKSYAAREKQADVETSVSPGKVQRAGRRAYCVEGRRGSGTSVRRCHVTFA